ncbi:hypothetical protein EVAR_101099_1 [Eumeta japonica]|uniref:Uncharacterized protein n=1 Tax=Eumeta variegata TaxID=151549 RepID=A0A4C1TMI4_EUMVA|nr:hypothetical protein EVAR_101099_1 [Eumeta japonica]
MFIDEQHLIDLDSPEFQNKQYTELKENIRENADRFLTLKFKTRLFIRKHCILMELIFMKTLYGNSGTPEDSEVDIISKNQALELVRRRIKETYMCRMRKRRKDQHSIEKGTAHGADKVTVKIGNLRVAVLLPRGRITPSIPIQQASSGLRCSTGAASNSKSFSTSEAAAVNNVFTTDTHSIITSQLFNCISTIVNALPNNARGHETTSYFVEAVNTPQQQHQHTLEQIRTTTKWLNASYSSR